MPFLRRENGDQRGQCLELTGEEFLIGRAPDCHLVLDPQGVSRKHARVVRDGEALFVEDLDSRNKTKLNDEELAPLRRHRLKAGDRINICDVEFRFLNRLSTNRPELEVIVTDRGEAETSTIHTLDATSGLGMPGSRVPPEVKLRAVLEISGKLSRALSIDEVAPKVLDSLFGLFPTAERAFLILREPGSGRLIRKGFKHRAPRRPQGLGRSGAGAAVEADEPPMSISRSIVNHVLDRKQAVLSQDAGNDANLPVSASIADLKIRSVMCAPLLTPDDQALGIIQLDTHSAQQFGQEDLDLLVSVASQAAISMQNARLHEDLLAQERVRRDLKLAESVQRSFLPNAVPKLDGYQFFAYYLAAHNVGGDYYDFVPLPGDRLAVALADVSGKGIPAALMMAKFSGDTRFCILGEQAPAAAIEILNARLCEAGLEERFITMSLSVLELGTGTLTYSSAGHLPLLVRRADGRVEEHGTDLSGFPLGILDDAQYKQGQIQLDRGDIAVIYSDGVTDPRNPRDELYHTGENPRLNRRVAELSGGPDAIGRGILQEIREFSAGQPQADDISLICVGRV